MIPIVPYLLSFLGGYLIADSSNDKPARTTKEKFLDDVSDAHDSIKSITLQDDSSVSKAELMSAHEKANKKEQK